MSAVNNNMSLPSLYSKNVEGNLNDLIDSFNRYTVQLRTPAPAHSQSPSQASLVAQALAAASRPEPRPLFDFSEKKTYVINVTGSEEKGAKKKEEEAKKKEEYSNWWLRAAVGSVATAIALFSAYKYGEASGEKSIVGSNKENLNALRLHLLETKNEAVRNAGNGMRLANPKTLEIHMTNLDAAIRAGEIVISQKSKDAKAKRNLAIGFVATAAIAMVGAVINSVPLMALSGVSAFVLTGYLLVKVGFGDATNDLIAKKAERVANAFEALRVDVVKYNGFENKNLPAPGYYFEEPKNPAPQVNHQYAQPINPNYAPQVDTHSNSSSRSSGPGSYGMNFVASEKDVTAVLAGNPMVMPHMRTPEPSAPPQDAFDNAPLEPVYKK